MGPEKEPYKYMYASRERLVALLAEVALHRQQEIAYSEAETQCKKNERWTVATSCRFV